MTDRDSNSAAFDPNIGPVHRIESRRSSLETYAAFYELYGGDTFVDMDGSICQDAVIGGRVLHRDNPFDRSMHLIVHEKDGNRRFGSTTRTVKGQPEHTMQYDPSGFVAITTDGVDIQRWQAHSVQGVYIGHLDTVMNPYMPANETLFIGLIATDGAAKANLEFNVGTMAGMMRFSDGGTGWILGERDSQAERARVLEAAAAIGHSAVAS